MKKIYFLIFKIALLAGFLSCSKEEEERTEIITPSEVVRVDTIIIEQPKEEPRYYVKYEVQWSSLHWTSKELTYMTDNGMQTTKFDLGPSLNWDGTYGPVKKGFVAQISCGVGEVKTRRIRIYVSRDKEPFVIKAETSASFANYEIDF